ncbi:MAG: hypothetical protein IJG33_16735 [Selenomonadaceae bacterium]|nr:hypothetical protein [Selenomonadaceae bacterium]
MADKDKFADEILSDEELDQVVGGDYVDTADDSKFLHSYGLCGKYTFNDILFDDGTSQEEDVKAGWAKVGVDYHYYSGCATYGWRNEYYINGNKVTRKEAYAHVRSQANALNSITKNALLNTLKGI